MPDFFTSSLYPKVITPTFASLGNLPEGKGNFPVITIRDFPLARKGGLWDAFPGELRIHPEFIFDPPILTSSFAYPPLSAMCDTPNLATWVNNITRFQEGDFPKVVLARSTRLEFTSSLSFFSLFFALKKRAPAAFHFGILLSPSVGFISMTPEKLFSKEGLLLETEAVAGTILRGNEHALLNSSKDLEEFDLVKQFLAKRLKRICKPFSLNNKIFIKGAGNVSHLHYPFKADLQAEIDDEEIIDLLHPTPAIGGEPRDSALDFIQKMEPFDRGWYAGTIHVSQGERSDVFIAIRSCIIEGNTMHIFTGCGVTKKSDPIKEWEEINNKRKLFGEWL